MSTEKTEANQSDSEDTEVDKAALKKRMRTMRLDAYATLIFVYGLIAVLWYVVAIYNGRFAVGSFTALVMFALATYGVYRKVHAWV